MPAKMRLPVIDIIAETHDTKTIKFGLNEPFSYKPGQFIMVGVPGKKDGKDKIFHRAYSLSSSPTWTDHISITVKLYPDGQCSPKICSMKPGDSLEISGPYGTFVFDDNPEPLVLIGAGSGIAPLRGILHYVLDKKLDTEVTLLYSSRTPEDIIFYKELMALANTHPQFHLYLTITRPHHNNGWSGQTGRIDEAKIRKHVPDILGSQYFLCGLPEMVTGTIAILTRLGVDKSKIKKEQW